jgi:voltage-gated potassium channel Kch
MFSTVKGNRPRTWRAWQDRVRDPSLTVLWGVEVCMVFLAAPLAARGLPIARTVVETLLLAAILLVVLLSYRRGAVVLIALGIAAILAGRQFGPQWPPAAESALRHGGAMLTLSSLTWVVLHAVFAPGRITYHRLQGAVIVYLNLAMIFASAFSLIWDLSPGAFTLPGPTGGAGELATMLYFSLTTLTTTGYGDIVPIDPFARSLANLESMIGVFYVAITIARLVTLELADRRH